MPQSVSFEAGNSKGSRQRQLEKMVEGVVEPAAAAASAENLSAWVNHKGEKVRGEFLKVLRSRRKGDVPEDVVAEANESNKAESSRKAYPEIDACPRVPGDHAASEPYLVEENFFIRTEAGDQGRVPVLIIRPLGDGTKRPAMVFLHSTLKSKDMMRPYMEGFAARGYVSVAIDSRYHGERAASTDSYSQALIGAWKSGGEMPFIFDTVWDLVKLFDYLSGRHDVDSARIGILGISLGGMHAWFAAVADPRYAAVVLIIAVQNFGWAVFNERWHARVQSIPHAFEVAREDLGKTKVDGETVKAVWQRIAPGLMDEFDAEHSIPSIAPRPLLIINGEQDPRCPLKGLEKIVNQATECYALAGVPDHFQFKVEKGIGHDFLESMGYDASVWMDRFLKPNTVF